MEEQEERRGRTLCAVQVAVVSGFVEDFFEMEKSCLRLCNACRDVVPMTLLRIEEDAPSSLMRMLFPGMPQAGRDPVSRVLPHRRVLGVEWAFLYFHNFLNSRSGIKKEASGAGATVDMSKVTWPEGTQEIDIFHFNQSVQGVVWPATLKRLY